MARIVRTKDVLDGQPRIEGHRIGTETLWHCYEHFCEKYGYGSYDDWDISLWIRLEYLQLEPDEVFAAVRYEQRPRRRLRRWAIARSQPVRAWLCERLGGAC